jgi:hypothetical protein
MKIELENIIKVQVKHEHPVSPRDIFCRTCGVPVTTDDIKIGYVCSECRHPVSETDQYCGNCGSDLSGVILKTEHYLSGAISTEYFEVISTAIKAKKKEKEVK